MIISISWRRRRGEQFVFLVEGYQMATIASQLCLIGATRMCAWWEEEFDDKWKGTEQRGESESERRRKEKGEFI